MTKQEESMESTRHHSSRRLSVAVALVAVAVALVAAGCGSSDKSSNSSSSSASAASSTASSAPKNSGLAQAQAFMKAAMSPPSTLGLQPTGKPIPTGKTVTYVHCGVDVCTTIG